MNKANKTFKKRLDRNYNRLFNMYTEGFKEFCRKHMTKEEYHLLFLSNIPQRELEINFPDEAKKYNLLYDKYEAENKENFVIIDELNMLLEVYNDNKSYDVGKTVGKYLNLYEFSDEEKAEIYAYFINRTMTKILSVDTKDKKQIMKAVHDTVKDEMSKFMLKIKSRKLYDITLKKVLNDQTNCKNLRKVIDEEGNIIPFQYATDLEYIYTRTNFNIDKDMFKLILSLSEQRFYEQLEEEKAAAEKRDAEREKQQAKREQEHNYFIQQEDLIKHQKQASRVLKQYIVDEQPTGYISSEDLVIINSCLNVLNFSDEAIMKIQKNIIQSNNTYLNNETNYKLELAKQKYLSFEEQQILNVAEQIILDEKAINNPAYSTILENYNYIKEELLNMLKNKFDNLNAVGEEAELVILSITDLTAAIENFKIADYRFVPTRKKESD